MEDIMHIQSGFLRKIISNAISRAVRKQGYEGVEVKLNDIFAGYSENEGKVHVHLDIDADLNKQDLIDILGKAGVL